MSYQLEKNILATIAYYDVLEYPLTAFEIWKHLIAHDRDGAENQACRLADIVAALAPNQRSQRVAEQNGLYYLVGREDLPAKRIQAEKLSVGKLRRMRAIGYLLACVPYVHMFGATGSLAMKNGERGSDWDMFVVLRSGKIWIGRTLLTGFLHCIGKRRHGSYINDRVCLNYFVTDDNLKIGMRDLFSAHEYRFFIPLYHFRLFQIFELKNSWIREYKPNFFLTTLPNIWMIHEYPLILQAKSLFERFLRFFDMEHWLSSWQKEKIRRNPKTQYEGSMIEAHDRALIFLPHPQGPRVFEKFKKRLGA